MRKLFSFLRMCLCSCVSVGGSDFGLILKKLL